MNGGVLTKCVMLEGMQTPQADVAKAMRTRLVEKATAEGLGNDWD